ncbi:hypothetical protein AVEN_112067-1 [Araneus ventricosus]|uniref:Uncharacterized protein n=1 Tax=Araneus ventricosus TaxID=182803 RepID=A0A4Y2H2F4_ARAVE|nr:hypothetical protein AVEN_200584-1 [Araneus ventricosus]GBM59779.1 hypothetical protein AVEN_112067-1 [Araneus ventricosus]
MNFRKKVVGSILWLCSISAFFINWYTDAHFSKELLPEVEVAARAFHGLPPRETLMWVKSTRKVMCPHILELSETSTSSVAPVLQGHFDKQKILSYRHEKNPRHQTCRWR